MAHTNETVNYHLSQFVGTDIPNPLVDYNGDMEKIDTAIKNVADSAVSEGGRITALETQNGNTPLETTAQTISGAVNELDGEVGAIDTRLTTAEGKITADEGTLATAVGNISTLSGKISAVETKVGTAVLTTTAPDLSGAVNELDAEDGVLDGKITALETQNGSEILQTTAQTLSGAINELYNAPASSVDADDVSYDNTDSGLTATNVQDAIDELKGDIDDISLEASNVSYDNTTSGLTATTVQGAIDEVAENTKAPTTIGTSVSLTSYSSSNPYVFPSNGYVQLVSGEGNAHLDISDGTHQAAAIAQKGSAGYSYMLIPVYKGFKGWATVSGQDASANYKSLT